MAVRSWRVGPDEARQTPRGEIGCVSRQAQADAFMDAIIACDRFGGCISAIYGRASTGYSGEMVTTGLIVNWQDRAEAKAQHEEPVAFEPDGGVVLDFQEVDELAGPDEPVAATAEQV